ncbi:MAG: thiamine/thiamine pyrophosphate ABC transporter permease ThiP [Shimia sp.]
MARRPVAISDALAGAVTLALLALTLGTLAAVASRADGGGLASGDWAVVRFTLWQAAVSAAVSCAVAVPLARALARRRFPGWGLLISVLGAPFLLPTIVAVLGLIAVFGRTGIVSDVLGRVGLGPVQIYGWHGIILAHVFFNLPLATRLLLQAWLAVPEERMRLIASLDLGARGVWQLVERPLLREVLPGAFVVIFLLCLTSFAVALTLGGGPRATTVELAIYEAFRFEFDLGRAAWLGLIQVAICALVVALSLALAVPQVASGGLDGHVGTWGGSRVLDGAVIFLAATFLLTPLLMLAVRGVPHLVDLPVSVWRAAGISVVIALVSMTLAVGGAFALALVAVRWGEGWGTGLAALLLATSPLVMGTGLFILAVPFVNPLSLALPVTVLVNAALAIPFALRVLTPAVREVEGAYGRLAESLDLRGWPRLRLVILPRLRRPLGFAAGLSAALSMGDLGVITLFADPDRATLPLEMFRLMSAYRMEQAAGAALLLLVLAFGLFWLFDRGGRADAAV